MWLQQRWKTLQLLSNGIFAVDKLKGFTSAEVLDSIKEVVFNQVSPKCLPQGLKFGHGGTLDQTASGVLVIGCGHGCKELSQFLRGEKCYIVSGHLGVATDTFNETGSIIGRACYDHVTHETINQQLKEFQGRILQYPPKYSALKLGGVRLADLTREGIEVEVNSRPVVCHSVHCFEFSPPVFKLLVSCGGGFYVRSLVHDLGRALNTFAHVTELRRIRQGPFTEEDILDAKDWKLENILFAIEKAREKNIGGVKQTKHRRGRVEVWDYRR